jgi:predicted nuclease with TOPRIM domain
MPNQPPSDRDRRGIPKRVETEDSVPIDMPPMDELIHRTRRATEEAKAARIETGELRDELKTYAERDINEHAELREENRLVRTELTALNTEQSKTNTHLADVRVEMTRVGTKLDTFVDVVTRERTKVDEDKKAEQVEKQSKRDHKRHLLVAVVGVVAGIIGALVHWAFH